MEKDERIERIKQWTFYRLFEERQIDKDIDSIESDLASLRERLAEAKHERDVARKALEILREPFPCPDTFCRTGGNCRQCEYYHALAMAEAEIKAEEAKVSAIETSEAIERDGAWYWKITMESAS